MEPSSQDVCDSATDGVLLRIKAFPGSRKDEIRGIHERHLKVATTKVAEKGKANKAIMELLAKKLRISKSQFELKNGETSSKKTLLIQGIKLEEFIDKLRKAMG